MKSALITGISGQDGSYLAEYLLEHGYQVWGMVRRDPASTRWLQAILPRIEIVYGDLRDAESLAVAFQKAWPDEIYNLAGQVFVPPVGKFPLTPLTSTWVDCSACCRSWNAPGATHAFTRPPVRK